GSKVFYTYSGKFHDSQFILNYQQSTQTYDTLTIRVFNYEPDSSNFYITDFDYFSGDSTAFSHHKFDQKGRLVYEFSMAKLLWSPWDFHSEFNNFYSDKNIPDSTISYSSKLPD